MKKYSITIILFVSLFNTGFAQNLSDVRSDVIKYNEMAKSGNYKDLFAGFLQLATTNLTGDAKTIDFNSTLFDLKTKANPDLKKDVNYIKETFSRNFQFNFKVNSNKEFKYQGFTGGFTWAAYNGRDKSVVKFGKKFDELFIKFNDSTLHKAQLKVGSKIFKNSSLSDEEKVSKRDELQKIVNQYLRKQLIKTSEPQLAADFMDEIGKGQPDLLDSIYKFRDKTYQDIETKPLWTISADGTADSDGKFNKASFGTVFLVGNQKAWNEIDLRAKLTYTDTLKTEHLPRTGFNAKAGMNFKIGKHLEQQSFFEVKIYGEYNAVFNNLATDEKKNTFLANSDIRIRLTDDLWIPITIKYDTNKSNFLGFLNVTYNFREPSNK